MKNIKIEWIVKNKENKNDKIKFASNINEDNGYRSHEITKRAVSTMELFHHTGNSVIEWYIDSLDMEKHIGLWFAGKELTDYDGVFELPHQAIKMLRELGYKVSKDFE